MRAFGAEKVALSASMVPLKALNQPEGLGSEESDNVEKRVEEAISSSEVPTLNEQVTSSSKVPTLDFSSFPVKAMKVKLNLFLSHNGSFPSRYRPMIWKFLLRLPQNNHAYQQLCSSGTHPCFLNIHDTSSLQYGHLVDGVRGVCSQMSAWSPIFAETLYLPQVVFPFLLAFENEEMQVALESVMTFFMWIGYSWHASFPDPPSHVLNTFIALLNHHDTRLSQHISRNGADVGAICWRLITSLFTEMMAKQEWYALMDFLFCKFENPEFFYLVPIAVLTTTRSSAFCVSDDKLIEEYYRNQQGVKAVTIINQIVSMQTATPPKLLSTVVSPNNLKMGEKREILKGMPKFPLSSGEYPIYDGYNRDMVDLELEEKAVNASHKKEVEARLQMLVDIEREVNVVEATHQQWMLSHEAMAEAEIKRKMKALLEEKEHIRELLELDEAILKKKVTSLLSLESVVKDETTLLHSINCRNVELLEANDSNIETRKNYYQSKQRHREISEEVEMIGSERSAQLLLARLKQEWTKNLSLAMDISEHKQLAAADLSIQQWKIIDGDAKKLRSDRSTDLKKDLNMEIHSKLDAEIHQLSQRVELTKNAQILDIEGIRAVRSAHTSADLADAIAEKRIIDHQKEELNNLAVEAQNIAKEFVDTPQVHLLEATENIRTECENLIRDERNHVESAIDNSSRVRSASMIQEWSGEKETQLREILNAERVVQEQSLRIKRSTMLTEVHITCQYLLILFLSQLSEIHLNTQNLYIRL